MGSSKGASKREMCCGNVCLCTHVDAGAANQYITPQNHVTSEKQTGKPDIYHLKTTAYLTCPANHTEDYSW